MVQSYKLFSLISKKILILHFSFLILHFFTIFANYFSKIKKIIMKKFRLYEQITGWAVFAIAAVVYLMTIEPSASFWDCGEFIASADKLEVGHPPGAPFFMLVGRIFATFASDVTQVAKMVNSFSALCSAFTILFLFWTITHLARRIVLNNEKEFSLGNIIAILGAGTVGALAYTFSDTFWFSAVEAEVYAFSSLFTAVVFWCILKWEDADDASVSLSSHSASVPANRWLILIAYLMGLSIGVHLLNLLAIPAIVLVYYFKKTEKITAKGVIIAVLSSFVILAAVLYGLVPGFTKVAGQFEIFFVNSLGMSFNGGLLVYLVITALISIWAMYETYTLKSPNRIKLSFLLLMIILGVPFMGGSVWLGILLILGGAGLLFFKQKWNFQWFNTIVVSVVVLIIGYATYGMIMIRSNANPPMDQNSPDDVFSLQSYLNREQYGDSPLFYGTNFGAPFRTTGKGRDCQIDYKMSDRSFIKKSKDTPDERDSYLILPSSRTGAVEKDDRFKILFPRMWSEQKHHVQSYKGWADIKGRRLPNMVCGRQDVDENGNPKTSVMPTFGENMRFFFSYQVNFMYLRYFMWNFVGRQNDIQSQDGEIDKGQWISGISFIDNARLGDQSKLPESLKNNKGRNTYFFLPLLLGIFGLIWQLANKSKGKQHFWITFTLFFMTGLAIVIYLNQTPYQPRERDYAYAGSFYAFCIWIGLGVMAICDILRKKAKVPYSVSAIVATLVSLGVPALMAQQNWDDHDRSGRYVARDAGYNYLNTCPRYAVLFCNGDNDTFPLWYNQTVEEVRRDIRACNLSYISAPWYIDQMRRGYYESAPLQISWHPSEYQKGTLDVAIVEPRMAQMDLKTALELMRRPDMIDSDGYGRLFASTMTIPVDKEKVIAAGVVDEKDYDNIVDTIYIKLGRHHMKNDLMVLEMLANNDWTRPIYICRTVGSEFYPNIQEYLQSEGMAQRFIPVKKRGNSHIEKMYDNMMNKYRYGNMNDKRVYLDETNRRTASTYRHLFSSLARDLFNNKQPERAKQVLDRGIEEVPEHALPFDFSMLTIVDVYFRVNDSVSAENILKQVVKESEERLIFVLSLPYNRQNSVSGEMGLEHNLSVLGQAAMIAQNHKSQIADEIIEKYEKYAKILEPRMR